MYQKNIRIYITEKMIIMIIMIIMTIVIMITDKKKVK